MKLYSTELFRIASALSATFMISAAEAQPVKTEAINAPQALMRQLGINPNVGSGTCVRRGPAPPRGAFEAKRPDCNVRRVIDNVAVISVRALSVKERRDDGALPDRTQTSEFENCRKVAQTYERTIEYVTRSSTTTQMSTVLEYAQQSVIEQTINVGVQGISLGPIGGTGSAGSSDRTTRTLSSRWALTNGSSQVIETQETLREPVKVEIPPMTRLHIAVSDSVSTASYDVEMTALLDGDLSVVHFVAVNNHVWLREPAVKLSQNYPDERRLVTLRGILRVEAGSRSLRVRIRDQELSAADCN